LQRHHHHTGEHPPKPQYSCYIENTSKLEVEYKKLEHDLNAKQLFFFSFLLLGKKQPEKRLVALIVLEAIFTTSEKAKRLVKVL
jgi:hypothetical protein